MTIKEQLEDAKEYGYPVRVMFIGCERKGLITKNIADGRQFMMSVQDGKWHTYQSVVSVKPVEPVVETPESGCLHRNYCKHHPCDEPRLCRHYKARVSKAEQLELDALKPEKAFIIGTHRNSFRSGEPAEVLGLSFVTPPGDYPRPCYHIRFADGKEDYTAVLDVSNYELITEPECFGETPEVMDDIAKQRWEWEEFATHSELYQVGVERDECGIATLHMATDEQKSLIEAAPEILHALKKIQTTSQAYMGAYSIPVDTMKAVMDAVKKAEGGQDE